MSGHMMTTTSTTYPHQKRGTICMSYQFQVSGSDTGQQWQIIAMLLLSIVLVERLKVVCCNGHLDHCQFQTIDAFDNQQILNSGVTFTCSDLSWILNSWIPGVVLGRLLLHFSEIILHKPIALFHGWTESWMLFFKVMVNRLHLSLTLSWV